MNLRGPDLGQAHQFYGAMLAHELRTPVSAILGYLELLEDDGLLDDPDALRQYLTVVRGRAAELARIVSELTLFTDLTTSSVPGGGQRGATTLPDLLTDLARDRKVKLDVSAAAAAAQVEQDRLRLILQQIIECGVALVRPGSDLLLCADLKGDPPQFAIELTVPGGPLPPSLRAAVFDPERQPSRTGQGMDNFLTLGLTVARRAAEGAGGALTAGQGTPIVFRLTLPLTDDPISRQARTLRQQAALADAQALRTIQDLRTLRSAMTIDRAARAMAEAQQLRAVQDFRHEHRQAVALAERLDRAYFETVTALAKAVEARDYFTGSHVERVRQYSMGIAVALGLDADFQRQLSFGALLHDIGKIGLPDAILAKPGALAPDEWNVVKRHPEIGRKLLEGIAFLTPALEGVAHHHERWDGHGYPLGMSGEGIPVAGRIVAVADAFDAMTNDRPYRKALSLDVALGEIERHRGSQFDPDVAQAFLRTPPRIIP